MKVIRPNRRTRMTGLETLVPPTKNGKSDKKTFIFSAGTFATSVLAIVALLGLLLTLAGYGVALSVESQFGLPHASIFKSNFDLFSLSVWFVTWGLSNSLEILGSIFAMPAYWMAIGAATLIAIVCCLIVFFIDFAQRWLTRTNLKDRFPNLKNTSEVKFAAIFTGMFSGLFACAAAITIPLLLCIALLLCFLIGIVPITSMEAGESHIRKYVIGPTRCISPLTREQRMANAGKTKIAKKDQEYGANCVKVLDGEKTIASGRVVFSTTELIVLYDPETGKVTRESTIGRSIEVVSQLNTH